MKTKKIFEWLRIVLFAIVLVGGCVLGFILTLRPAVSQSEGRKLTEFPKFTVESFLSGEYTAEISKWYADSYPGREVLLDMNGDLKGLYGVGDSQFSGYGGTADELDTNSDFVWNDSPVDPPSDTDGGQDTSASTPSGEQETTPQTEAETKEEPKAETIDGYYVKGDTCWELYYYKEDLVDRYCRVVVNASVKLQGKATVYDMVVPVAPCYLPAHELKTLGASEGIPVIEHIYSAINAYCPQAGAGENPVVTLRLHDLYEQHKDDYLFFRTDHHWTANGAYYASRYFLDALDRPYPALSEYTPITISESFLGSLYRHTQSESLKRAPETIIAYQSPTVQEITIFRDEIYQPRPLINTEATNYNCFSSGDHEYYEAHNPTVTDGSKVLIIKESYGNAFIPMVVDSFEYVYAVDYRFWEGDLVKFVEEHGIDTVLFLNNLYATADSYTVRCIEGLVNG